MLRALLPRFLLITALLFAQLGGLTHGIAHALEAQGADSSLPHDKHCDLCAKYAQLGSALGSSSIQFSVIVHDSNFDFTIPTVFRSTYCAAYTARSPPYSA